jgi:hypothetical protein
MNKWISVEDQLPDFKTKVLCFWPDFGGGISIGTLDEARYIHTKHGVESQRDWTLHSSERILLRIGHRRYDVTHWMPIPKAPKVVSVLKPFSVKS